MRRTVQRCGESPILIPTESDDRDSTSTAVAARLPAIDRRRGDWLTDDMTPSLYCAVLTSRRQRPGVDQCSQQINKERIRQENAGCHVLITPSAMFPSRQQGEHACPASMARPR